MGAKIRVELEVSKDFYDRIDMEKSGYLPDMILPSGEKQILLTKCVALGRWEDAREKPTKYFVIIECFTSEQIIIERPLVMI